MRDVIVSLFILGSLPTCYRRPFIGLLMFTLLAYMRVQDLTWGFARYQRWSYYVALATILGFLLVKSERKFMTPDLRNWMMILLAILVGGSLLTSRFLEASDLSSYVEFCKIIGVALFTTGVVKNREYLRILMWVIALSFGFYGVKNGLAFLLSGGSLVIIQGPGGMLSDNNDFALALCMGIPLLLQLGLAETRPLLRRVMLGIIPLMVMTIVATHSRGAFLAMAMTAILLVWRSRNRVAGFAVLVLILGAGALAAPKSYTERLSTIGSYEQDSSAVGRLEAWKVAGHMIASRPFLGVGFAKFQQNYRSYDTHAMADDDGTTGAPGTRVAHNSYLQIWAECGTPAFLLYLGLIALSFFDLWKVRREAELRYHASWILSYTTMFEASMLAFVVGSFFLNRAQFDLFYHFVAIIIVFGRVAREAMADPVQYPQRDGERGQLVLARDGGFGTTRHKNGFARAPRKSGFGKRPALGSS
jgi:probable O-glycosylation ligase (exosortase A-associated)